MSDTLPLFSDQNPERIFAWTPQGPIPVSRFLAQAHALANQLPAGDWLLNVCSDRYHFALGFVAGLLSGKTSLQPAAQTADTLRRLAAQHPGLHCLRDDRFDTAGLPCIDFPPLSALDKVDADACHAAPPMPQIAADRVVAILFTSGSTGTPQPQRKTWGKLVANARAGCNRLGLDLNLGHPGTSATIVATVPAQHSYGFESSFLPAFHAATPFWSGKPFYPQDIAHALAAVPAPRVLVSTPFHLAALLEADLPLPPLQLLLSATAPLDRKLAAVIEQHCQAPLHEIYGSTESGQLASRRTCAEASWTLLDGVRLHQQGEQTWASGEHVEGEVVLGDLIDCVDEQHFMLRGRHSDLINIAGKRTSLAWLNHQLCTLPGVRDGAFFLPPDTPGRQITRLAAAVVAPGLERAQLLQALRERIDAAFLPRPLLLCDRLPRNSTGKLPREALLALHAGAHSDA